MTMRCYLLFVVLAMVACCGTAAWAQDAEPETDLSGQAQETLDSAKETADQAAKAIDKNEKAQEISAGILKPIYQLAEAISHPAFHWIGFAIMVAGVVSFALQLTLGKLVVLAHAGFSPAEILSDSLGLVVSLVGLVLTTQAAAENSSFTGSASAVISATVVGAVVGFLFYLWGQRQEVEAAKGRSAKAAIAKESKER